MFDIIKYMYTVHIHVKHKQLNKHKDSNCFLVLNVSGFMTN